MSILPMSTLPVSTLPMSTIYASLTHFAMIVKMYFTLQGDVDNMFDSNSMTFITTNSGAFSTASRPVGTVRFSKSSSPLHQTVSYTPLQLILDPRPSCLDPVTLLPLPVSLISLSTPTLQLTLNPVTILSQVRGSDNG